MQFFANALMVNECKKVVNPDKTVTSEAVGSGSMIFVNAPFLESFA